MRQCRPRRYYRQYTSGGIGTYTYQWQQSTDGTNYSDISGANAINYDPGNLTQTTYFRRVVISGVCSANNSSPVIITINTLPPTPAISPNGSILLCTGSTVIFTSSSATNNQWYKDNVILAGETNQSYTATATGAYTVKVTNASNCSSTSIGTTVTVNLNPSQPIITSGGLTTFCSGGNVVLSSSYPANNQWLRDGNSIAGATSQQYTASGSGNYSVRYTQNGCSAVSTDAIITVNSLAATPVITVNGASNFCPGGSVSLTSSAASGNQWYLNNAEISGATGVNYIATEAGSYTVQYNIWYV